MTTVIGDARLGVIVADSRVSDGDRVWSDRKVFRYQEKLYGFAGQVSEMFAFMTWIKGGPEVEFENSSCLMLSTSGLFIYDNSLTPQKVRRGIESIGSGAKAAMCAYKALGFSDPAKAVRIVCKHDSSSSTPVRVHKL